MTAAVRAPLRALDRSLAWPAYAVVRVLAWAVANFLILLLVTGLAIALFALPPLSLLPSRGEPMTPSTVILLAVVFGSVGWPLHLGVVAAVSRLRRARLWIVLSSPLLGTVVLLIPYLLAPFDSTNRSVVLAWTLYGLLCRPLPPARARTHASRPGLSPGSP